jgi:hypothetical protein
MFRLCCEQGSPPRLILDVGELLAVVIADNETDHGGGKRHSDMLKSGGPLHPHDAKSGIKVHMDV